MCHIHLHLHSLGSAGDSVLYIFEMSSLLYFSEVRETFADIPIELPCSSDIEDLNQLLVRGVLMILSYEFSQVSDVKSLALRVTSTNLVSLETGSIVEYVFPCFQLGKFDLGVT